MADSLVACQQNVRKINSQLTILLASSMIGGFEKSPDSRSFHGHQP
jgi:hypothetical protein